MKKKEKKDQPIILKINLVAIIISTLSMIYGRWMTSIASQYPEHVSYNEEKSSWSYCGYLTTKVENLYLLAFVFLLMYIVMIIIAIVKRKKYPKKTILKIIAGFIICIITLGFGLYEAFVCTTSPNQFIEYKPILYLYPEKTTDVEVRLDREDLLETTYPKYNQGWKVEAHPNGDLFDAKGNYYYALYWDAKLSHVCLFEEGFYVEKEEAITFLEEKLTEIGLNDKEKNEFIMYWLPILERNEKSIVQFDLTEELQEKEEIVITPKPNSLLRVHINIKKVNQKVDIKEQKLTSFNRVGFTAVEWGGSVY